MMVMKAIVIYALLFFQLLAVTNVAAENWVEFHAESWSYYSDKLHKKLNFKTRHFYDADSVRRSKTGGVKVWLKEVAENDRFYVRKGNPEKETSFTQLKLWCDKKKFVVMTEEGNIKLHESLGDEMIPGTRYDMLYGRLCTKKE